MPFFQLNNFYDISKLITRSVLLLNTQADKSSESASSEDTWPGEILKQNSTRVPDFEESSKTRVNKEEDEVNSMAVEIQTIHECEVNSQGMKECEVGDRLNRMNDLDTSRTQSLQDDRRTFEVIRDRGLQNQGVELGGNKPLDYIWFQVKIKEWKQMGPMCGYHPPYQLLMGLNRKVGRAACVSMERSMRKCRTMTPQNKKRLKRKPGILGTLARLLVYMQVTKMK